MPSEQQLISKAMSLLGKRPSKKKSRQARINGKKHRGKRLAMMENGG